MERSVLGWKEIQNGFRSANRDVSFLSQRACDSEGLSVEPGQIDSLAGMVDINAHQLSFVIKVKHDTRSHFLRCGTDLLRKIDVERIHIRIVVKLHDADSLKQRSRRY